MSTCTEQSDELLAGFIDESVDALQQLATQLGRYRQDHRNSDAINSVFRSVHSIKGNAGFFGLTAVKRFAHSLENTLDDVRNHKVNVSEDLERALVEGFDFLEIMLQRVLDGDSGQDLGQNENDLLERVSDLAGKNRVELSPEDQLRAEVQALADEIAAAGLPRSRDWAARLTKLLGTPEGEEAQAEEGKLAAGPPAPAAFVGGSFRWKDRDLTPQVADLIEMFVAAHAGEYRRELGESFLDHCNSLSAWAEAAAHESLASALSKALADFQTIFHSPLDVDAVLLSIVWETLAPELAAMSTQPCAGGEPAPAAAETSAAAESAAPAPESAAETASSCDGEGRGKARLLRVKEERIDEFLDDVSGLFITCERLKDLHARMADEKQLSNLVDELRQVNHALSSQTVDLQKSVVSLRKVPVRGLLSKFPRLARTLATSLGKKINVQLIGEETEVDKSLAESLDAPLTHMVRNVADHAIEMPNERRERGVDEAGNLWIKAEQTRTHVVITVQDDGRGIDPSRLRRKIVEKGILTQAQADALTNQEAVELIFHPGFSTAEKISDISGRGVGMDVVRTTIREQGGEVHVASQVGVGTTFRLEIPIRQAVLVVDGLLLEECGQRFVVSFDNIREICKVPRVDMKTVQGFKVTSIRGQPYAAVHLRELLQMGERPPVSAEAVPGVLLGGKQGSICLLVDRVVGQRKVVVNNLTNVLNVTDTVAGVAQLGGGRLALVLSALDLVKSASTLGLAGGVEA